MTQKTIEQMSTDKTNNKYTNSTRSVSFLEQIPLKPQRFLGASMHYKSGNCQEFASASYLLLKENLPPDSYVFLVQGNGPHYYCIVTNTLNVKIGNIGVDNFKYKIENAFVIDPWIKSTLHPMAVEWLNAVHKQYYPIKRVHKISTGKNANIIESFNYKGLSTNILETIRNKFSNFKFEKLGTYNKFAGENNSVDKLKKIKDMWDDKELIDHSLYGDNYWKQPIRDITQEELEEFFKT